MAEWLEYSLGIGDNVRKLSDVPVEVMLDELSRQLSKVQPGGKLWFYFAGHVIADPATQGRVLLGGDANSRNPRTIGQRGLPVNEIKRLASQRNVELVLILNACYTGGGRGSGRLITEGSRAFVTVGQLELEPYVVEWVATDTGEVASPFEAAKHGTFTYFVVGALRGWADGELDGARDGKVSGEEARAYVKRMVGRAEARQQPKLVVGGRMKDRFSSLFEVPGANATGPTADLVERVARGERAADGSFVVVEQKLGGGVSRADAEDIARKTAAAQATQRSLEEQRRQEAARLQAQAEEARRVQEESERKLRALEAEAQRAQADAASRHSPVHLA